ncbi:hypothetical protein QI059_01190 [Staphylococcus saprophyticus]|nr:hypothetical protein [Staphylococcus saprophyticus]
MSDKRFEDFFSDGKLDLRNSQNFNASAQGNTVPVSNFTEEHDIIELKKIIHEVISEHEKNLFKVEEGEKMNNHVKREEFENFKSHIDTKFDNSMKEFREEMRSMRTDINNNMNSIRTEMNTNTNNLRNDMQNSISKLPTNADVKNILLENNKELDREAKQNRNTVIGWLIGFVGLGFTAAKAFGWL